MSRRLLTATLCALTSSALIAQSLPKPPNTVPRVIQERIPASTAYLLWLQAAALQPSKLLRPIGLSSDDERAAFNAIYAFESVFMAHSHAFDNGEESRKEFGRTRDLLVEKARSRLATTLSPQGMSRLDLFVLSVRKTPPQVLEQ